MKKRIYLFSSQLQRSKRTILTMASGQTLIKDNQERVNHWPRQASLSHSNPSSQELIQSCELTESLKTALKRALLQDSNYLPQGPISYRSYQHKGHKNTKHDPLERKPIQTLRPPETKRPVVVPVELPFILSPNEVMKSQEVKVARESIWQSE